MTFDLRPSRLAPFLCALVVSGLAQAQSWPMHQGNASHTGHAPVTVVTDAIRTAWSKQLTDGGVGLTGVAVANGRLFVSSTGYFSGQFLYALNAATGKRLWKVDYGSVFSVNPPSYADGLVYVQTGNHGVDTWLRGLDAKTGEQRFQSPHAAQWERYLAPTVYKNQVYVNAGYYGGMQAFRKDSGVSQWFLGLPQYDQWTPAVDERHAYSFVGGTMHVVDRPTGQLAFTMEDPGFDWTGWSAHQAPVLGGQGDVYVTSGGRLVKFDVERRRMVWKKDDASYLGQAAIANGVVYASSNVGVIARAQAGGERLWTWWVPSTESVASNLVITNTHLFVSTNVATHCVDLTTHQTVWTTSAVGQLAVADGHLYIAGATGLLTAVKLTP